MCGLCVLMHVDYSYLFLPLWMRIQNMSMHLPLPAALGDPAESVQ